MKRVSRTTTPAPRRRQDVDRLNQTFARVRFGARGHLGLEAEPGL